jgi:hypothetical protein
VAGIRAAALHSRASWKDLRDAEARATRSRGSAKESVGDGVGSTPDAEDGDKAWEMGSYHGVEVGKVEWVVEER